MTLKIRQGTKLRIETKTNDNHQVELTVILDQTQFVSAKHRAARHISEKKSIPGFRPGKAPYDVVQRSYGDSLITETAVDLLLDEIYPKAIEEAKIEPGAPGFLVKVEDLEKEPKFIFNVPLAPKVELGEYKSVRVAFDWKGPGEKDVDQAIEEIRQMYAKTETVNRPAQIGDFILIDVKSDLFDGETPLFERSGYPVFIRSEEKGDEWPYAGFSKELIGLNIDETKQLKHKYSKEYLVELARGKVVTFEIKMKMVRGTILPELTTEFIKQLGPFETVEAFKSSVMANLASRLKAEYEDEYFENVIDKIKAGATIKYAPQTLEHEIHHVKEDLESRLTKQGLDLATYIKTKNVDEEKFMDDEIRPTAIKRLERSLLLDEISRIEKIEVSKQLLDDTFQQTYFEVAGSPDFQKFMKGKVQPPKQILNALARESANRAYLHQTLERLKEIATGKLSSLDEKSIADGKPEKKTSNKRVSTSKKNPEKSINN